MFSRTDVKLAIQKLLEGPASAVTLYSKDSPLIVTIPGSLVEELTQNEWDALQSQIDIVARTLPGYQAKSSQTEKKWDNLFSLTAFGVLTFSTATFGFFEREWRVLEPSFWWYSTLIGGGWGALLGLRIVQALRLELGLGRKALQGVFVTVVFALGLLSDPFFRWVNAHYSDGNILERRLKILKKSNYGGRPTIVLEATDWSPQSEVRVSETEFEQISNHVDIRVQNGALGVDWIFGMAPAANEK